MTDSQIRTHLHNITETIRDVDNPQHAEKVRRTWAACAAKWLLEIVEELDRRIGKDD